MISKRMRYTEKQLKQFSSDQMRRFQGRTRMPKFIKDVGKEKCDEMFKVLQKEVKK